MRMWKKWGLCSSEELNGFLMRRATQVALAHGHTVSTWTTAKKKMGKGAHRAMCHKCGMVAFVLPYGQHNLAAREAVNAPTITGEALSKRCAG